MDKSGILLIGPYYSGKTSCSRLIGRKTGWKVLDLDEMYTERFGGSIWATRNISGGEGVAATNRDQISLEILAAIETISPTIVVFGGGKRI